MEKLTNDYNAAYKSFLISNNKGYWIRKLNAIHDNAEEIRDVERMGTGLVGSRSGYTYEKPYVFGRYYDTYQQAYNELSELKKTYKMVDPLDRLAFNKIIVDQWTNNVDSLDHSGKIEQYKLSTYGHYDDATGTMVYTFWKDENYYRAILLEASGQYKTIYAGASQQWLANIGRMGTQTSFNMMSSNIQSGLAPFKPSLASPKPATKANGTYENKLDALEGTGVNRNTVTYKTYTNDYGKGTISFNRQAVLDNIAESKAARQSSNFGDFVRESENILQQRASLTPKQREIEIRSPKPVRMKNLFQEWDNFLGDGQNNINPRTNMPDSNRIFNAEGDKAIRLDKHEMNGSHYHEEHWEYNGLTGMMEVFKQFVRHVNK